MKRALALVVCLVGCGTQSVEPGRYAVGIALGENTCGFPAQTTSRIWSISQDGEDFVIYSETTGVYLYGDGNSFHATVWADVDGCRVTETMTYELEPNEDGFEGTSHHDLVDCYGVTCEIDTVVSGGLL